VDCESTQKLISLYLAGDLPNDKLEEFMAHIASCSECRAAFAEAKRYEATLKGAFKESVSKSRSPKSRVLRKIKDQGPRRRRGKSLTNWFVFILLTAALCLLIIVAYVSYTVYTRENIRKSLDTKRELALVMESLRDYHADHGSYPASSNKQLVKALKTKRKNGNAPYYSFRPETISEGIFVDSWKRPLIYRSTGETALLYSTGSNGIDDGGLGDDIRP
jgi:uncharacterized protein CbrC (UPF0167 family)